MIAGLKKKQFATLSIVLALFLCIVITVTAFCQQEEYETADLQEIPAILYGDAIGPDIPKVLNENYNNVPEFQAASSSAPDEFAEQETTDAVLVEADYAPVSEDSEPIQEEVYYEAEEVVYSEESYSADEYAEPEEYSEEVYTEEPVETVVYEEPVMEAPVYEEPVYTEPVYEEVVNEEPVYEEPVYVEEACVEEAPAAEVNYEEPYSEPAEEVYYEEPAPEIVYEEPAPAEEVPAEVPEQTYTEEMPRTYLGNFMMTAYCPCPLCCGAYATGRTASGTVATEGVTVAMGGLDFGTQIMINGHIYTVEDRGTQYGHVDIFFASHEAALAFGLQYADVYLVG